MEGNTFAGAVCQTFEKHGRYSNDQEQKWVSSSDTLEKKIKTEND